MIAIFDLDGTLSLPDHRRHFLEEKPKNWKAFNEACEDDKPNIPVIALFQICHHDYQFILSGRSEDMKYDTVEWLEQYGVMNWDGLYMREKGDHRDDTIVKKELFQELKTDLECDNPDRIFHNHDFIIFDDRQKVVDMWREMGLTCCQVAPGNF